jgi:A/G-specific adenine glycosylase
VHDSIKEFKEIVWDYYAQNQRKMPWRANPEPYWVLVSELMLQQTQVSRVLPKFEQFIATFPTVNDLSKASLAEVLTVWSGLGYNRRAKFLHATAQAVHQKYGGKIPATVEELVQLPGIGKNTAGAIMAYAFNNPVVFIETNIRTVFFYHFFANGADILDIELIPLIQQTLDNEHPREWYWALMDYGTFLKQTIGNNTNRSRHYTKQSAFKGSRREIRGRVLKHLVAGQQTELALRQTIVDERLDQVIHTLLQEGLIEKRGTFLRLTGAVELP